MATCSMYRASRPTKRAIGASSGVAVAAVPCNRPSISSFNCTLGGTLFMALISSGPASTEPLWFDSPRGYQRLFAFTGSLGHHPGEHMKYKVVLKRSDEGFSVSSPGLPGCWSQGDTEADALANIRDAIREYFLVRENLLRDGDVREVEVG